MSDPYGSPRVSNIWVGFQLQGSCSRTLGYVDDEHDSRTEATCFGSESCSVCPIHVPESCLLRDNRTRMHWREDRGCIWPTIYGNARRVSHPPYCHLQTMSPSNKYGYEYSVLPCYSPSSPPSALAAPSSRSRSKSVRFDGTVSVLSYYGAFLSLLDVGSTRKLKQNRFVQLSLGRD